MHLEMTIQVFVEKTSSFIGSVCRMLPIMRLSLTQIVKLHTAKHQRGNTVRSRTRFGLTRSTLLPNMIIPVCNATCTMNILLIIQLSQAISTAVSSVKMIVLFLWWWISIASSLNSETMTPLAPITLNRSKTNNPVVATKRSKSPGLRTICINCNHNNNCYEFDLLK